MIVYSRGAQRALFCSTLWGIAHKAVEPSLHPRHLFRSNLRFIAAATIFVFVSLNVNAALARSIQDYPSFTLKIFGYEARIFYLPRPFTGGLSTAIGVDQRYESAVHPSGENELQKMIDKAAEVKLIYSLSSRGSHQVDLLSTIPSLKPFYVSVSIYLKRAAVLHERGAAEILSTIEQLSNDPDRSHFDEYGYRMLTKPVPYFVMQHLLYSRPDGRPLSFFRQTISRADHIFTLTGSFRLGDHAHVDYTFRTDQVAEEHWVDIDKAMHRFATAVLAYRKSRQ